MTTPQTAYLPLELRIDQELMLIEACVELIDSVLPRMSQHPDTSITSITFMDPRGRLGSPSSRHPFPYREATPAELTRQALEMIRALRAEVNP